MSFDLLSYCFSKPLVLRGLAIIAIIVSASACSSSNQAIDTAPRSTTLLPPDFDGTWRGRLSGFEAPGFYEGITHDYELDIVIENNQVRIFDLDENVREEIDKEFQISIHRENIIIYSNYSRPDRQWIESWSFVGTKEDDDTLLLYLQRVVHNIGMPRTDPNSRFAFAASGRMSRDREVTY